VIATGAGAFRGTSSLGVGSCELNAEGSEEDARGMEGVVSEEDGMDDEFEVCVCILKVVPGAN